MNKLVLPVVIGIGVLFALASAVIGVPGFAALGIERATAEQVDDGTLRSTMDVDVAQKLGSLANVIIGIVVALFALFKGWVHVIAQWIADRTSGKPKAKKKVVTSDDDEEQEEYEELPADRKLTLEDMLLEAVYAKDRRRTILWCHELSGSDYLTAPQKAEQPAE